MESTHDVRQTTISSLVSRRATLRGLGGAGMATALALGAPRGLQAIETAPATMIEPGAGSW